MDHNEPSTHTYSVTETTHHVPALYWLNKHFWFEDYERVKSDADLFDTNAYTITGVRFNPNESPNESKGNPDGKSIWLTVRSDYQTDLPADNPHHASFLGECSLPNENWNAAGASRV